MSTQTMRTWKIGDVEITRIVEVNNWEDPITMLLPDATAQTVLAYPWLQPSYATREGKMIISFQCFVMRTREHNIMLDTCIGSDRKREFDIFTNMKSDFLSDLQHAGCAPEDIDIVLCTHLHFDHVGWNTRLVNGKWVPTFPNARYLFGRKEYEHWKVLEETHAYHDLNHMYDAVKPVIDAGLVDLIGPDHAICPELKLRPTPGHTPGHVSIAIESRGQRAIVTGDMMHNPIQLERPDDTARFDMDQPMARRTRVKFIDDLANTDTLVIGSHFSEPTAGFIVRDEKGCRLAQEPAAEIEEKVQVADSPDEALVRRFFDKLNAEDYEALRTILHPQATWKPMSTSDIPGAGAHIGHKGIIDEFLQPVRGLFVGKDPQNSIQTLFGKGGQVVAETHGTGRFVNGKTYDNRYCWVIDIKDGLIFTIREYMDTAYIQSLNLQ